jgi:hypothetical protein
LFTQEHRHLLLVMLNCLTAVAGDRLAGHVMPVTDLNYARGGRTSLDRAAPAEESTVPEDRVANATDTRGTG